MIEKKCKQCQQNKPIELFRVGQKNNKLGHNPRCKDCLSFVQKLMPYPILKQPLREFILSELKRLKK